LLYTKDYAIITERLNIVKEEWMKRSTKSLLEELNEFADKKHTESVIESRANHIIDSAVNLITLIKEQFDQETAFELEKRFINSIRSADPSKFTRGIRKIRDNKETAKTLKIVEGDAKDPN
jgi:DNA-binding transcriptional regulator YbjK